MNFIFYFVIISVSSQIKNSLTSGFTKDINLDVQFPPPIERREGLRLGHLRPLGWQSRPDGTIEEETIGLTPEMFYKKYLNSSKPIVLRGLVSGAPAIDKLSDTYLTKHYGKLDIHYTKRKERSTEEFTVIPFRKFLKNYRVEDWYLRVIAPKEMHVDLPMPYVVNCGPYLRNDSNHMIQLTESHFWMSAGETSSLLHSRPQHNLHCILDGRKDVMMIPSAQFENVDINKINDNEDAITEEESKKWHQLMGLVESFKNSDEWTSKIDVDMVNTYKFPLINKARWYWSTLRAGDCIYIPANYLNQIRSHGRSISTSIYFTSLRNSKKNDINFDRCNPNEPLFDSMNKSTTNFLWQYTHAERHLNERDMNGDDAKRILKVLCHEKDYLNEETFKAFYTEIVTEMNSDNETQNDVINADEMWQLLLKHKRNENIKMKFLTVKQIEELNNSDDSEESGLKQLVHVINAAAVYHEEQDTKKSSTKRDEL
jgi:hypothetical protein